MALAALNLLDAAATHSLLSAGLAREANPLMRTAWESSPWAFLAVKLLLVNGGALVLWRQARPEAAMALLLCLAAYAAINAYHLAVLGNAVLALGTGLP